jgi:hypothetical protein
LVPKRLAARGSQRDPSQGQPDRGLERAPVARHAFAVYGSADSNREGVKRTETHPQKAKRVAGQMGFLVAEILICGLSVLLGRARAQTDCAEGNGVLDMAPLKNMTPQELIQKFAAEETKVKQARAHYTYTQDVLVQTLTGKAVDGQFHEITSVSYDDKGRRVESVSFAEQPTLRGIQLSQDDTDDIRVFMPWILTTDEVPQYNLTYAGQQHVDDLDTFVFHAEPKKEEKGRRYFQGRVWVDRRDLQIVKLCGKSVPEAIHVKKRQPQDLRPTFVSYRQPVDGHWFPAYTRVDDTLHFQAQAIHVREIVKFTGYKRTGTDPAAKR